MAAPMEKTRHPASTSTVVATRSSSAMRMGGSVKRPPGPLDEARKLKAARTARRGTRGVPHGEPGEVPRLRRGVGRALHRHWPQGFPRVDAGRLQAGPRSVHLFLLPQPPAHGGHTFGHSGLHRVALRREGAGTGAVGLDGPQHPQPGALLLRHGGPRGEGPPQPDDPARRSRTVSRCATKTARRSGRSSASSSEPSSPSSILGTGRCSASSR